MRSLKLVGLIALLAIAASWSLIDTRATARSSAERPEPDAILTPGGAPTRFDLGGDRDLLAGTGPFEVAGVPDSYTIAWVESVDGSSTLWVATYEQERRTSAQQVSDVVDPETPIFLDQGHKGIVVGWRAEGIWKSAHLTRPDEGESHHAAEMSLGVGRRLVALSSAETDGRRILALVESLGEQPIGPELLELDPESDETVILNTLPRSVSEASMVSSESGISVVYIERESSDLFYLKLDANGSVDRFRKLNAAPAVTLSRALGSGGNSAVIGWIEQWPDHRVAMLGRIGVGSEARSLESRAVSAVGKTVGRIALSVEGGELAVWDESDGARRLKLVSLDDSWNPVCESEIHVAGRAGRVWLLGARASGLLFTTRPREDDLTALSVRDLGCVTVMGPGPHGLRETPLAEPEYFFDAGARILGGADEPCDGLDNDGNGTIDDGCDKTCESPDSITGSIVDDNDSFNPSLAWTGNGYGVAWERRVNFTTPDEIYFARLDSSGHIVGGVVQVSQAAGESADPVVVWTGTQYGVAWQDMRDGQWEIYFAKLDSSGNKIGAEVSISGADGYDSEKVDLVWSGSEFGLVWQDSRHGDTEIYFARVNTSGGTTVVRVTSVSGTSEHPSLTWGSGEYGLAWEDGRDGHPEVYFTRLSTAGSKLEADQRIDSDPTTESAKPSIVWSGSEYGVAFEDVRSGDWEIHFGHRNGSGTWSEQPADVYTGWSGEPVLTWTGVEYGVWWKQWITGTMYNIFYRPLDPAGNPTEYHSFITGAPWILGSLAPVWNGTGYGLAWHDNNFDYVKFWAVGCCDDEDGDGYTECDELNDGDPSSFPGASESCDGRDNDGNDGPDEDCDRECTAPEVSGSDVRLTNDAATSVDPSMAWTGTEYGLAWEEDRDGNLEIYFTRANASGVKAGGDIRVTNAAGDSEAASLVWTGSEYGLAWHDDRDGNTEIYFARLSADGTKIGSDVRISDSPALSEYPSLVWTGSEYAVAWEDRRDGNREIYFARIDGDGNRIGTETRVTDHAFESYRPSLEWNGYRYGIAWHDYRDGNYNIYFARVDELGIKDGDDIQITTDAGDSYDPTLVPTDTGWAVAWHDNRVGNTEIYMALLAPLGGSLGDIRVTNDAASSNRPSLAWTGAEFGVTWIDDRDATWEIFFTTVDGSGAPSGAELKLTDLGSSRYNPDLVWTGYGYAVSWYDNRDFNSEIYFARVACCDDVDGDGYSECAGDPNDADSAVHPEALETCDGSDEDGDGSVDELCDSECDDPEEWGDDIAVTSTGFSSSYPDLAWNGSGYGVAWDDHRSGDSEIYFALLDSSGNQIGTEIQLSNSESNCGHASIVWTGAEYGVAWSDFRNVDPEVYFARVDRFGNRIGDEVRLIHGYSQTPSLVWTGNEYGLAWQDSRHAYPEIYFSRLDSAGNRIGPPVRVTTADAISAWPSLAWTGSQYAVAWHDERDGNYEIYFARLDSAGGKIGSDVRVTVALGASSHPSLVWTGTGYGLAWSDARDDLLLVDGQIYWASLDTTGSTLIGDVRVTWHDRWVHDPSLVWTGSEYGLAWEDHRTPATAIYFTTINAAGTIGTELPLTGSWFAYGPSVVWTGSEYATAWYDDRTLDHEIYLAILKCCDDADADGWTECAGDTNDADPLVNPDAVEICDGEDDDSDGFVDELCDTECDTPEERGYELRITFDAATSAIPSLAWTGGEYGVAWEDMRDGNNEIYFTRLDRSGSRLAADLGVTSDPGSSKDPSLAWTGNGYGVAWKDNRDGNEEIYFTTLGASGGKTGTDVRITSDGSPSELPSLAWNGSEFGVVWEDERDGNREIYFARIDAGGNKIGADVRVTQDGAGSLSPRLVWSGSEYGLAWRDNRDGNWEIYFVRLDHHGVPLDTPTRVTSDAGYSASPSLVWTGSRYGLVWNDTRTTEWEIFFAALDSTGTKIVGDIPVTADDAYHSWSPSLAWSGDEYGLAWIEERDGNQEIYFTTLGSSGAMSSGELRITLDTAGSQGPRVLWDGGSYATAWEDHRDGNWEIYFSGIACCDDRDADGYSECAGDSNDADPLTNPGVAERCDGYDNDSDGARDEVCDARCDAPENRGSDIRVTADAGWSGNPSLAWTGAEHGIAWHDDRTGNLEIHFARLDLWGGKMGTDLQVTSDSAYSRNASLVWTGEEYGVAWHDGRDGASEIYFARIDSSGVKLGSDVRVTTDPANSYEASLVWTGSEYGVAWNDTRDGDSEIYFARLDASGNRIGSDLRITWYAGTSDEPSLVWTGSEYGIAWHDSRGGQTEIYFARLDSLGNKLGTDVQVTTSVSQDVSLVWSGAEYGVAWADNRNGLWETYFARLESDGSMIPGSEVRVTGGVTSEFPSLVWTGAEYGLAWRDLREGAAEIYFTRISADGPEEGAELRISAAPDSSEFPSLAWTGSEYVAAWVDQRDGNREIYFTALRCCDDVDRDGYSECAGDSNDRDRDIGPDVAEACDGEDDDSDGSVDEGCDSECNAPEEWGDDVRVTDADGFVSETLSVVWTGSELGAAWRDERDGNGEIYFSRLDTAGNRIGGETRVTSDAGASTLPAVAWTGWGYGVSWTDNRDGDFEIYFARFDDEGAKIGPDTRVTHAGGFSSWSSLVWNGSEYAVVWHDQRHTGSEIFFARIDAAGNKIGPDVRVTTGSGSCVTPHFAWTGSEYGVVWRDDRDGNQEIYFARLDPLGHKIGTDVRVTSDGGVSDQPYLVWNGSGYGVTWRDDRDGNEEIYFTLLDATGTKPGPDLRITNDAAASGYPRLAWNGHEYSMAWRDARDGNDEIYFARLDGSGAVQGTEMQLTNDPGASLWPSPVWTGVGYAVGWSDDRTGSTEVHITRVRCCDDVDADGYSECNGDSDDLDPAINPDRLEICDVRDNDSDGLADDTCDLVCDAPEEAGGDSRLTNATGDSEQPSIAWNGAGFGITWHDDRDGNWEIYFARLDPWGNRIGDDVRVTYDDGVSHAPAVAWNGTEYALVWHGYADTNSDDEIKFVRLDASGNKIGNEVLVTRYWAWSKYPAIVWNGSGYGVAWSDTRGLALAQLDPFGRSIGEPVFVRSSSQSTQPGLVWTGSEYGVAWTSENKILFARFDAWGGRIDDEVFVEEDPAASSWPQLAWNNSEYGVTWMDLRNDSQWDIYFARIDSSGVVGSALRVTDDPIDQRVPRLVATGQEYGLTWTDNAYDLYFARIDASGTLQEEILVASDPAMAWYPNLAWSGNQYTLAWNDWRHGDNEIYVSRIRCCDDLDADGYTECAGDTNDADATVNPGSIDTCDARDNNSDGQVDESCNGACNAPETWSTDERLTNDTAVSGAPDLEWNGAGYGLAWHDERTGNSEIFFARLDSSLRKVGIENLVTGDAAVSANPTLAWTGSEYGVAWRDSRDGNYEIYFNRLDADGGPLGSAMRITEDGGQSYGPSMVWTGSEYGVAWQDDRDGDWGIWFSRIDPAGNKIGPDVRVSNTGGNAWNPFLIWTGSVYAVAWREERDGNWEIYFARIDELGNRIGDEVRVTNDPAGSRIPSLAWTGSEYGIAWYDQRDGNNEIYFTILDADGNKPGADVRVTSQVASSAVPRLVWTGDEYGVVWYDNRHGNFEVLFATLGPAGNKLSPDLRISNATGLSEWPVLAWSGSEYAMAWQDDRDGNYEIYLASVRCCADADGDGYTVCAGDTNDIDPDIHPGATESCDGVDNNGNGDLDEVCDGSCDSGAKWGSDLRVTSDAASSTGASPEWTGEEYGLAWADDRDGNKEIYFARIGSSGQKIGSDIRITQDGATSDGASLAWTGSEYGLAWRDSRDGNYEIYFTRLDVTGNRLGPDVRVTNAPGTGLGEFLVWTGSEYGLVWSDDRDGNYDLYFTRLDADGTKIGTDVRIAEIPDSSWGARVVWTGDEYGVVWRDHVLGTWAILFATLDSLGNLVELRAVTDGTYEAYHPSVTWTGSEYGISWQDQRHGNNEIYFARLDSTGSKIGSDVRVTTDGASSAVPRVAWTGSEYVMVWYDNRPGNFEIYFARLDSTGAKIGSDERVTTASGWSDWPDIVWNGAHFGVAWADQRDGNYEIYFALLKCCGNNVDVDAFGACDDCDDLDDTVYPGATEICDHKDNDCNAVVDDPFPIPGPATGLVVGSDKETLSWNVEAVADRYDVVGGDLSLLRSGAGDFTPVIDLCVEDDSPDTQAADTTTPGAGDGLFYLVRAEAVCQSGTYDSGHTGQAGNRDDEIEGSSSECP